jgi:predicted ATPase/DNA-binding SARP family transcriptional activator
VETSLRLWGPPELVAGDRVLAFVPERRFQLLAWLALQGGQARRRDEAAALLWPEHELASARRNLRKVLLDARAIPGTEALQVDEHALCWPVRTDIDEFDTALRRGPPLQGMDQPSNTVWTDWLQAERARLDARWQRAAHQHLATLTDAPQRDDWAQRLLAVDPLDDAAMAARLQACLARGAVAVAHQAWRAYAERLAQELGIEPPAHLRALIDDGAVARVPAQVATATAPLPAAAFVGRKLELAELSRLLARPEGLLVTLLGPGGVGKSRLAGELVARLAGPVLAVEMQDLDSASALAARLAQRLGVVLDDRRDTAPQIAAALAGAGAPCLLMLDNAEQIADLPAWLARLRAAAPAVGLLVTSRTRLLLPQEQVVPLQGLALPDEDSLDIDAAPAFDAVRLFAARAEVALPGFDLAQHLPAVIDVVQQCAGLPLAIELAAAWVRLLPPAAIARELRESIDLLERDPASGTLPARPEHTSLRAVFERSLGLLAPRERDAAEALAVFRGSFTRAAAQAVADIALPLLASLVDKSLLATADDGRFVLHPLLAALALERLRSDSARSARLLERHARHHLRRLADAAGADTRDVDALIDTDEPDLRQAWRHALDARLGDLVAPALTAWAGFFERRGRSHEGAALLRPALQWPAGDAAADAVQGRARAAVARLQFIAREPFEHVHALAAGGLDAARRAGDVVAQIACLSTCAACDSELGRYDAAQDGFEQARALADAQGLVATAIRCLRNLGSVATRAGDYTRALDCTREAERRAREGGLGYAEADALMAQAGPHLERTDWSAAEQVLRRALPLAARLGARQLALNGRCMLGCALIELGRLEEARAELQRVRDEGLALGQPMAVTYADTYGALADARAGRLDHAEAALRDVATRARETGQHLDAMRALLFHGEVLARRGDATGAAAAWDVVAADATLPVGERDTARRWRAALVPGVPDAAAPNAGHAFAALLGTPRTA